MDKFEVCPICRGRGNYVNPSIDSDGLTSADFEEAGDEFREDYLSGVYDVQCECCEGQRVVTRQQLRDYYERLDDHRTMLAERGIRYSDSRI